jgi:HEAT repeat protein
MLSKKIIAAIVVLGLLTINTGFGRGLEDDWNDFLHYTKIGRLDLAKGYAQAVLNGNPEPIELLKLSESNPQGYAVLLKVVDSSADPELAQLGKKLLDIIEQGKFVRRADPKLIVEEIKRLSGTARGRVAAAKHLQNAGEYAVPYMLEAMADSTRKEELTNIIWALPQVGRDAIRPLAAALQTKNASVKIEIINALGEIGYPQSLAYLKYIVEKDDSPELTDLAKKSVSRIDPAALDVPAAQLFYRLAENYYYHADSLAPSGDANSANIWFWDAAEQRLIANKVDKCYFNELMTMRNCEWALKADPECGMAIGLWLAASFKAESCGVAMPAYFTASHPDAIVYATTAGAEYLHQALARAVKDKDAYVALGVIEALATTAGEKSLFYSVGAAQPLIQALSFDNKAVKYSAAIAIASAGPLQSFPESKLVVVNLAQALGEAADANSADAGLKNKWVSENYAIRAAKAMLKSAQKRTTAIDLSAAQDALITAAKGKNAELQALAGQVLAYLPGPDAQRAIAAMAMNENNDMKTRLAAFDSLALSGKLNANLLDDKEIAAIYSLVSGKDTDPQLRSAAAAAFGSLNLPSKKVKDLILDQSKS